ncbi:hypothetical protein ABPG72_020502 [Tetrahymena utriculariae]
MVNNRTLLLSLEVCWHCQGRRNKKFTRARNCFQTWKKKSKQYPLRNDWESVKDNIMYEAIKAKFTQHDNLKKILLSTKNHKIVEHTKRDAYWADGGDGQGKNMLGILLMKLRKELSAENKNEDEEI